MVQKVIHELAFANACFTSNKHGSLYAAKHRLAPHCSDGSRFYLTAKERASGDRFPSPRTNARTQQPVAAGKFFLSLERPYFPQDIMERSQRRGCARDEDLTRWDMPSKRFGLLHSIA